MKLISHTEDVIVSHVYNRPDEVYKGEHNIYFNYLVSDQEE